MNDKERIWELINDKIENDICDFKLKYYDDNKKYEIIKDITSFANSPLPLDKYIIFNVDNETRELGMLNKDTIPDVSEINNILREYCEPHIQIELNGFENDGKYIAYIKIKACNVDRPYIIKKDYSRNGKIYLSQGHIYIRRNANNYKANRHDLDEIYDSREKCEIRSFGNKIIVDEIIINKHRSILHCIRFVINNESKFNFSICKAEIEICSIKNAFRVYGRYIEDMNKVFLCELNDIADVPFSISSNSRVQKTLYFFLSQECDEQKKKNIENKNELFVKILMTDINGKIIKTELEKYELDDKRV